MKTMARVRALSILTSALLLAASCSPTLPDRPPTITGGVVALGLPISFSQNTATVHVKQTPSDECGIVFQVDERTVIRRRNGDHTLSRATFDDLAVGQTVAVWGAGYMLESCPGQSTAQAIEIRVSRAVIQ